MWFNNLKIYQLSDQFSITEKELESSLSQSIFKPCGQLQMNSIGWIEPIPRIGKTLTHTIQNKIMICANIEDKILPAAVVNEFLNDKIIEIEDETGHKPGRRQKTELKEEIIHSLLPRAFSKNKRTYAYFDLDHQLLIVNSASAAKAEEFIEFLRKTIGSLPVTPITQEKPVKDAMTTWLSTQEIPMQLTIGQSCVLSNPKEDGGSIRCSKQELLSEEIQSHLKSGMQITKLALTWADKINFVLSEDFSLKQIKFTDLVLDTLDDSYDDIATQFDADFNLMSAEFSQFVPYLQKLFT
ncbi:MAG: recombination-associated protein RdgC [Gammaproteobacteria bacterium]|nr:recombination-associated protein RdgC [Gammaproteobacteria bacterium]